MREQLAQSYLNIEQKCVHNNAEESFGQNLRLIFVMDFNLPSYLYSSPQDHSPQK